MLLTLKIPGKYIKNEEFPTARLTTENAEKAQREQGDQLALPSLRILC